MTLRPFLIVVSAFGFLSVATSSAVDVARPDIQNLSSQRNADQTKNGGVTPIQGIIKPIEAAPGAGAYKLTEASFGQAFSPYQFSSSATPNQSYARQIEAQVRAVLYPPAIPNRGTIDITLANGGAVFRYKYLLFSKDAGGDVTTQFQGITGWFGDPERDEATRQIAVLRNALVTSPTDTGLRDLLLEVYYDLAIAEMQVAKQKLAALAAKRLGFEVSSPFVIEDEITIYSELITLEEKVLGKYNELFTDADLTLTTGAVISTKLIDPADFDDREFPGKKMGFYIFKQQQPYRNAIASSFATDTGEEIIPDYSETTESATPRLPENLVLFAGYKDYVTLLRVMAQFTQHHAELARLRTMRQNPNDLTKARNAISDIQNKTATEFLILRQLFGDSFLPSDASGVLGAINGMETALAEVTKARAFANSTANQLGLDPNFLLLVRDPTPDPVKGERDSFDVLFGLLKGPNQPLSEAVRLQGEALIEYQNFRASVDRVVAELAEIDNGYQQRYFDITGFDVDENPGFQGTPKLGSSSELDEVNESITSLRMRAHTLSELRREIHKNVENAQAALAHVEGLDGKLEAAVMTYETSIRNVRDSIGKLNGAAAYANTIFDAAQTVAGLDFTNKVGGQALVVGLAAAGNAAAQTATAKSLAKREAEIDIAAVTLESALQKQNNALTVNQARQELSANLREQNSIWLESTDNNLAMNQALAQRLALINEVQRITSEREEDASLVKGSYYADPIHFVRAENALLLADAAFRNAQRWLFYTQRAAEYKWQSYFAISQASGQGIRSFNNGTIFKLRNANELDNLLTQLKNWNDLRLIEDDDHTRTSYFSFKDDILAPNPNVLNENPSDRADPNVRLDLETGQLISTDELFHRLLERRLDAGGNLSVDFNTYSLESASFNVGPDYSGANINPGEWRDRIVHIKVNIVFKDGPSSAVEYEPGGSLTYGGQAYYRTRIPPQEDRSIVRPPGTPAHITNDELPGAFLISPFRYYSSAAYNDVFSAAPTRTQNLVPSRMGTSANGAGVDGPGTTFEFKSFSQYSVAASGWHLSLSPPLTGWSPEEIRSIQDIEFIVHHTSYSAEAP